MGKNITYYIAFLCANAANKLYGHLSVQLISVYLKIWCSIKIGWLQISKQAITCIDICSSFTHLQNYQFHPDEDCLVEGFIHKLRIGDIEYVSVTEMDKQ